MHGLIHVVLKDLILAKFGESTWKSILHELSVTDDSTILQLTQYDDATTVAGITATTKVLGIDWDDALRVYGGHFVNFAYTGGHLRMLESMGDNLKEFLRNLNHMHNCLERVMREARFPSFHISDEEQDSFRLSYASVRGTAVVALVEGVLPAAAKLLHKQSVRMEMEHQPLQGFTATWRVQLGNIGDEDEGREPAAAVADPVGAASSAGLWHVALMGLCCKAEREETEELGGRRSTDNDEHPASKSDVDPVDKEAAVDPTNSGSGGEPAHGAMPRAPEMESLDELERRARESESPEDALMRAVPCCRVCADWDDADRLSRAEAFWRTNVGDMKHFEWTSSAARATRFISHSWFPPTNWHDVMGSRTSYAVMKATELHFTAMEIAAEDGCNLEDVTFWIDKCCIPQMHSLKGLCISMIEGFLKRCDGMIVLLTWEYFERLWCVYEWAAVLVSHPVENITICLEAFFRPTARELYLDAIKNLTVDNCKCTCESDRPFLKNKVQQYYTSERNFEALARSGAIAMIVRTLCRGASRSQHIWEEEVVPYIKLARDLQLDDLAEALGSARPREWRQLALQASSVDQDALAGNGDVAERRAWQPHFVCMVDSWFADKVVPVLARVKQTAVRSDFKDASQGNSSLLLRKLSSRSRTVSDAGSVV